MQEKFFSQSLRHFERVEAEDRKKPTDQCLHFLGDCAANVTQPQSRLYRSINAFYLRLPVVTSRKILMWWHVATICIVLYFLFEIGLVLGFGSQVWKDELQYMYLTSSLFISILIFDMLVTPLKATYIFGHFTTDRQILLREYLQGAFWLDAVALTGCVVPYIRPNYVLNYCKLLFLLKTYSLYYMELSVREHFKTSTGSYLSYMIGRLMLLMILISHYLAGFYAVSFAVYSSNVYGANTPNYCWIYNAMAYSQMVLDLHWTGQYAYAMYFSVATMTTIAYGDITPLNPREVVFVILALTIYCLSISYFLSEIIDILTYAESTKYSYFSTESLVNSIITQYRIGNRVASELTMQMEQTYLEERYRSPKVQTKAIAKLSPHLRFQLLLASYAPFLIQLNFQLSASPFLMNILQAVREERVFRGETLFEEGELFYQDHSEEHHSVHYSPHAMILVGVNSLPQYRVERDDFSRSSVLGTVCLAGLQEFFSGCQRQHWAINAFSTRLYSLSRNDLLSARPLASPEEREILALQTEQQSCLFCSGTHSFKRCPFLTYLPSSTLSRASTPQKRDRKQRHKVHAYKWNRKQIFSMNAFAPQSVLKQWQQLSHIFSHNLSLSFKPPQETDCYREFKIYHPEANFSQIKSRSLSMRLPSQVQDSTSKVH